MNQKSLIVLFVCIIALVAAVWLPACDTGGGDGDDGETDIQGHPEECNVKYHAYMNCARECEGGGFCLEGCVTYWIPEFVDCCGEFDGDTSCIESCFDDFEACVAPLEPEDHYSRADCADDFGTCNGGCPPPLADPDTVPPYEDEDE